MRKISTLRSRKKLLDECLNEMFLSATPPISWKEYCLKYGGTEIKSYKYHYLNSDRYEEILGKYIKRLDDVWIPSFVLEVVNYAPTSGYRS